MSAMNLRIMPLFIAAMALAPAYAETIADRWNLADLYPSISAWNDDAVKLDGQMKSFAECKGKMGESAARFKECLDLQADMTKRYYRLAVFAGEQLAEDTGSASYLELDQKSDLLGNRLTEATAFVDPEVMHIGREGVAHFFKGGPSLAIFVT